MPKFSVSNIAFSPFDHIGEFLALGELGLSAIEVAPSRVWQDTWKGLKPADVSAYRKSIESTGLCVVGLHSLFFDHPELGLFGDAKARAGTLDFLVHLSQVCRDLGGRTLIWGGGRKRDNITKDDALDEAVDFMGELVRRTESHGTCFCFEPLGPKDTDFINTVHESVTIVEKVDHPALRVQLDAKALVENEEAVAETFTAAMPYLVHYHANEPGLGVLGSSGTVDHAALGGMLRDIRYDGYVSIEQRMLNEEDPLADIAASAAVLRECYS